MDRLQLLLHEGGRQWVLQWLPKSRYRMTFPVQNYNNMNMFLIWFGFRHQKKHWLTSLQGARGPLIF
jgi:hypothetical protein